MAAAGRGPPSGPTVPPGVPALSAPAAVAARPVRIGVVCGARDARVVSGAVALGLLGSSAARVGVVLGWTGDEHGAAGDRPASPAARRSAAALRATGSAAWACGRLVHVALPAAEAAAAEGARAALLTLTAPVAVVVSGPRGPLVEELLAEQDRIVLARRADADADVAELAVLELALLGPPVASSCCGRGDGGGRWRGRGRGWRRRCAGRSRRRWDERRRRPAPRGAERSGGGEGGRVRDRLRPASLAR